MKKIFIALTAAVMALTLCACGGNDSGKTSDASKASKASTASTASAASTADTDTSKSDTDLKAILEKVKAEVKMPADTSDFNAAKMKRTFGIEEDLMDDFAGLYCTDGLTQDEIVYVKAKNEDAAKKIEEQLQKNWESKYNVIKNYSPEQVKNIESAKVEKNGLYVSLVISADADKIKSIFSEGIK